MNIKSFEAVCFYEMKRRINNNESISDVEMLIFDVDTYSVGFCKIDSNNQIKVLKSKVSEQKKTCLEDIDTGLQNIIHKNINIWECINPYFDDINRKMRLYYQSEKRMNTEFNELSDFEIDCSTFDEAFSDSRKRIEELLHWIEDQWVKIGFDENECEILIIGKAARLYPITYIIKNNLTFDPFLSDDRFVCDKYVDSVDEIVDIGIAEYRKQQELKRTLYIFLLDSNNKAEKKQIPINDMADNVDFRYLDPIFVAVNEKIELEYCSKKQRIAIPYSSNSSDSYLFEIGACVINNKLTLRLRNYIHPDMIYDIPIM